MKILGFDVETTPNLVWTYDLFSKNPTPIHWVVEPQRMACVAARFKGESKTYFFSEWEHGQQGMAEGLYRLFEQADALETYNGKGFDEPWARTLFAQNGLTAYRELPHIDLYQQTKRFRLPSHKLEWVSTRLARVEGKVPISLMMEIQAAIGGDLKAQRKVKRYNVRDVSVLFEIHDSLGSWFKLPNALLYHDVPADACPRCLSTNREQRGYRTLTTGRYKTYHCLSCGGWSRSTTREKDVVAKEVGL
jgi:hypothetical protein